VKDHCYFLDSPEQAQHFQKTFLNTLMRVNSERATNPEAKARIRIVGAAPRALSSRRSWYTRQRRCTSTVSPARTVAWCRSPLLEAGPRLLPALPERISRDTLRELQELDVDVKLNARITQATPQALGTRTVMRCPAT